MWYVVSSWIDKFHMATERKNSSREIENLTNVYVILNSDRYRAVDYNLLFVNQKFSRVYGNAALFGDKFFGMDELIIQHNT